MKEQTLWQRCLQTLEGELSSQQFNTWIRPLQVVEGSDGIRILAPNRFIRDRVETEYAGRLGDIAARVRGRPVPIRVEIGDSGPATPPTTGQAGRGAAVVGRLNPQFTFENHVEGKSNQFARAAAVQVGSHPGHSYNPLVIFGGVGLGKTHLMQAAGNLILSNNPRARVAYVHSERFVSDMVRALQNNAINDFKREYRSLDALLIDDIQFFSGKPHSQEEFFHTFNTLLEGQRQIILTSDRFPKDIPAVEERLVSRFGAGLNVKIEPPELETRVAILKKKALSQQVDLPEEVAFYVASHIESNIRDLEGALHRIVADSGFTGRPITVDLAREALKDHLAFKERLVTIENIQKTVAQYYKIRLGDLLSKQRSRQVARPRQLAMALAKELTNRSLPEIGDAFGGRDHTTVIHACRRINALKETDSMIREDYENLIRLLKA